MMNTRTYSPTKPEDEELARKRVELAQLESELADRELYIATLRAELGAFEQRYLRIVGARYAELDDISAQLAEHLAQDHSEDERYREASKQAREVANESRSGLESYVDEPARAVPSQELKSLYREVAKRVHPDLSSDPADRKIRQRLMAEANLAYELGDVSRLKRILEEYECSPETVPGEGTAAELVRVIRKITQVKSRLIDIEQEAVAVTGSELAKLKAKSEAQERQGRDLLAEMAAQVDMQIAEARQRLSGASA